MTHTHEGSVKQWNPDKYFGFFKVLNRQHERDVFFHGSALGAAGIQNIAIGDRVLFNVTHDPKSGRNKAVDIRMVM